MDSWPTGSEPTPVHLDVLDSHFRQNFIGVAIAMFGYHLMEGSMDFIRIEFASIDVLGEFGGDHRADLELFAESQGVDGSHGAVRFVVTNILGQ